MEYSFAPYQSVPIALVFILSTLGGIVFGGIASIVVIGESDAYNERRNFFITMGVVMGFAYLIGIAGYANRTVHENIPVTGILVDQYAQQEYTSGKNKRLIDQAYVVYKVPEGEVSFRRGTGVVYPKEAILYMNKKR